ncbi:MAG: hypothetical protein WCX65_07680 [bacterium]
MSAYYTGTMTFFGTGKPFGQQHQAIGGGKVTFTGALDFEVKNAVHSIYIAYDIANDAVSGHTVDAKILPNDIKIEGALRSPVNGDPAGSRTIFLPTGSAAGIAPCQMLIDSNPSFMSIFITSYYFTPASKGDCPSNQMISDLAAADAKYAGLWMKDIERFDPQQEWVEFSYNLSSYGITGRAINSLAFNAEMYLVGIEGGTAPTANPADWAAIYESKVQLFNYATGLWEDMGSQFLTPTPAGWRVAGGEAYLWDETADSHPEKPLLRAKTSGFSDAYMNSSGILKIRVWIKGALGANFDESSMVFNTALINFNYGSTLEQANWRWLDADESPSAIENKYINAPQNAGLHLRAGIRSNFADRGAHYLGVQYDTNANFTAPVLMTSASPAIRYWDDTSPDHVKGDPVVIRFLNGADGDGIYHEDQIPPAQAKQSGILYEEDFTIQPLITGAYYLRIVQLNGDGTFKSVLDSYAAPIKIVVEPTSVVLPAYNWSPNTAPYAPSGADTPLEFTIGTDYIAAIRVEGKAATANAWRLEYQKNPYTNPGDWTPVTLACGTCDWKSVNGAWGADEGAVAAGSFVTGAGAGAAIAGRYDENGVFATTFALGANQYTEFWWSIRAQDGAAGNAYRFRVTNAGSMSLISYLKMPEARQTVREQTSYRWADENEDTLAPENEAAGVAVNQPLHLRVGVRSDHNFWSSHKIALQYDTDSSFPSPTLVTSSSGSVVFWDDTDRSPGDPVSGTKSLSGSPYAGIYHESANQPAPQDYLMNLLYEEDFSVAVTAVGAFYLRVVAVDNTGGNPQPLELYTQTIAVNAAVPSNIQSYFAWAQDASNPQFSPTNNMLVYLPGNMYLLSIQIQNSAAASSVYNWQLQSKKTSDPPGDWTNVTATSADWTAANCAFGVDGKSISTTTFSTNGGIGVGAAESGFYSEKGVITDSLGANSYSEYWYCVKPAAAASKKTYEFRLTNTGSTNGFIYNVYPDAAEPMAEMTSYRWADGNEAALDLENTAIIAAPGDKLHVRLGARGDYGSYPAHKLGIQYDTTNAFTAPVLMTAGSPALKMWDDTDRVNGAAVSGLKILSGAPASGLYHEDNTPFSESARANVIYEEDFTILPVSVGVYYIRLVEIDSSGNFLKLLDRYTNVAEITISNPTDYQTKFNWSANAAVPAWNGENATLDFTTGANYIVAVKIENDSALKTNFDWQLQYQKDPYGNPEVWTNVSAASGDWKAADGPWGADGAAVNVAAFSTVGFDHCAGCAAVNGVYSETGKAVSYTLGAHRYTEVWYSIKADPSALGFAYRFRVTNSGSTYGVSYMKYPDCRIVARQQASFRWADRNEAAIDLENAATYAVVNDELHLRVGLRSRNDAWSDHKLALQYDTDINFTAPTLMTAATQIKGWNDPAHAAGDTMSGANMLAGSPLDGVYHEDNNQPAPQTKALNFLYEEDFTVRPDSTGTYYFRTVTVDNAGSNPVPLDMYSQTIELNVVMPNNYQAAYNWSENLAAPAFFGNNVPAGMTSGKSYIVAVQIDHTDPNSAFNWRLQYQKDPNGTPGPWTDVTTFSSDWKALDGPWGADGAVVPTASFVTAYAGAGSPVAGKYSETGIVNSYTLSGARYAELWFSVKPQPAAMNFDYRFRLTNAGSTNGFRYDRYPEAKHPPTTGTIAISELMNCCTENPKPVMSLTCEDPAGTNCNAGDSMRFSCDNVNWSPWLPFAVSTSAFDITSGAGCVAADGQKTVYVEYKNEYNAIQILHASDKTVYDTTAPEIISIPNIQTIMGNDCPVHGTTDGVVCNDPSSNPMCTVWYQSRPGTTYPLFPGAPNQFTVVVNWTDNMQMYESQWKLQGDAAYGDPIQTPDTENPWQQFYNVDAGDTIPDQLVDFTVFDKVGHTDKVSVKFSNDNQNPDNPDVSGYASAAKVIPLVSGTWYPYDNPYFEWPVPNDNPVGHAVGIEGYYVEFSNNSSSVPNALQSANSFNSVAPLTCGSTYYLRIRSRDHVCNVPNPVTTFVYRYDNNPPVITNNIAGCPSCDNTWRNAAGATYDVDFSDSCGNLKKADYIVYSGAGKTGSQVLGWTTIADNIAFPTYTIDWPVAFNSLPEGVNYVSIRLTDEAGNVTNAVDAFYVRKDTVPPAIVYNSPISAGGYTPWYSANVANDVDLQWASGSPIVQFDYRIASGAWTNIWTGSQSVSYAANWLAPWAALPQGETRISVRGLDSAGNWRTDTFATGTAGFIFRKDSLPPDNPAAPVNGWEDPSKTVPITTGVAYSYPNPYFEWAAPSDYPAPLNSGVGGYYVGISTNPALVPTAFQTAASYTAPAMACNTDYYLRIRTRDQAIAPNVNPAVVTAFTYRWGGQIGITDNQPGDDTWRNANGGVYDVDFKGGCDANINTVEYTLWSAAGRGAGTGTQVIPWTVFLGPALGVNSYTANWKLKDADFGNATDGINFVSVRVTDANGLVRIQDDVFYVLKDTQAPPATAVAGFDMPAKTVSLASGSWYNYSSPYFEWAAASDLPAAPAMNSGFKEYIVYFGTDTAGVPSVATAAVSFSPSVALVTGWTYYLRISSRDNVGNTSAAATAFTYRYDSTSPGGVAANGFDTSAKSAALAAGTWHSYEHPYFEWSAASDLPATPANSGLMEYRIYFGTDSAGAPNIATTTASYTADQTLVSGWTYYLRLSAADNAGNVGAAATSFSYMYDGEPPNNPPVPANGWLTSAKLAPIVDGGSYTSVHPYFEWSAPADNPVSPANAGLDGYYVVFSTDPFAIPTAFQTESSFNATTSICNATHTLRISARDLSTPPNISNAITAFTYYKRGSVTIVDNQPNDDAWRNAAGTLYDVDFLTDCDNLDYVQYSFWSAADMGAGTGTQSLPWTTYLGPGMNVSSFTADWAIRAADFAAAAEGINWVSIRAFCTSGISTTLTDAFYFRKDVTPPNIPTGVFSELSDYLWVSPANGNLYYGTGMGAAQMFMVSGTANDALSGLQKVTFSAAYGDTPADAATPANWSAGYDIDSSNTTAENVTVTAYDNAGNMNTRQLTAIRDNNLQITYLSMTPAWLPTFVMFKVYYPDGVTEMTANNADGIYKQAATAGPDDSKFARGYDRNGASVGMYDDPADAPDDGLAVSRLVYQTGAGDSCGSVNGTNAWCLETYAAGCVSSVNPHYIGIYADNIKTDGFYANLPEEKTIDGDLGAPAAPPLATGTPGSFEARSGPDYIRVIPMGDGLILSDEPAGPWCSGGTCPIACGGNFCSNMGSEINAKPDFVKSDTGAGAVILDNAPDNTPPAPGEWSWDSFNNRIVLFDNPATITMTLNGQSEMVCAQLMDACDQRIDSGAWQNGTVQMTLSDAPGSGKSIARNEATAARGFDNVTAPASLAALKQPDQLTIKGDMRNGMACVTLTAENMPNDNPMTPVMVTPEYFGVLPLGHKGGGDKPGFVLIRPNIGVASGTTSFGGITGVSNVFMSTPNFATQAIVLSPAWRHDGGKLLFISRQSSPCGGDAAVGEMPYGNFNLFTMDQTAGTLGNCVRLTRNGNDGMDDTGVSPYSEVAWSVDNERAVFAAADMMGNAKAKLFWVGATASVGVHVGAQYDYPPAGPVRTHEEVTEDIVPGGATVTISLSIGSSFNPGENVIVYETIPGTSQSVKRTITTVVSVQNDLARSETYIRVNPPIAMAFDGSSSGGSTYIDYPITLRQLGQGIVPLDDDSEWIDPDWSGNNAECDAAYRDKLIAVRAPNVSEEDTVCNPSCAPDADSSTNANIVMIDGAKDAEGMYRVDGATSNLRRITMFKDNSVWPLKPKWSPDCRMIAFLAWDRTPDVNNPTPPSKTSVYVINLSAAYAGFDSASLPITSLSDAGVYKIYDYASYTMPAYEPGWSADGKLVSYSVDKRNTLDISAVNYGMGNIVEQLFSGSDYDSYLEYIPDQPKSQGGVFAPQLVGQVQYNELYLTQCPSHAGSACPNKPNTPYVQVSQMSAGTGAYLRMLTISNESAVTSGGGLLFQDGIVTAVFPPNSIASDTVFYNTNPTAYCGGGAAPGPNCPADPTTEYIVAAGDAREYFPDGTNFSSYIRLIFHYCDNDNDGMVDAGTESINAATANGTQLFQYDPITGNCSIAGAPTGGGTVDVDTLGVYNWNTDASSWVRMDGLVDKNSKTITIFSSHFSRYDTLGFKMGFAPQALTPLQIYDVHTYPNPYVESMNRLDGIRFAAAGLNQGNVTITIKVYDIRGSLVSTLMRVLPSNYDTAPDVSENGAYTLYHWRPPVSATGRPLASGVYLYYLTARTPSGYEVTHKGKFSVVR